MYDRILVPLALDNAHPSAPSLDVAHRLLKDGGQITVLHVMEALPEYVMQHIGESQRQSQRDAVTERLRAEVADLPNGQAAVLTGKAGRAIVEYAKQDGSDCIVIASHRPGMQDYLLGSTAARVVRHAGCAVHVLR